jgi:hypothetical protein
VRAVRVALLLLLLLLLRAAVAGWRGVVGWRGVMGVVPALGRSIGGSATPIGDGEVRPRGGLRFGVFYRPSYYSRTAEA